MDREDIYVIVASFGMAVGIFLQVNSTTKYILFSTGGFFILIGFLIMLKRNNRK